MQIDFFTGFYKKENSTKRPASPATTHTYTGYLREPCSILHPSISIKENLTGGNPPLVAMYAYIPRFFRYYFVKDWVYEQGVWTVNLTVDVLASWRTAIGESTEYVLRTDSTTNSNGLITDMIYPSTDDIIAQTQEYQGPFTPPLISSGVYVVGIISGDNSNSVGAITYYLMTSAQFGSLKEKLFSVDNLQAMGIVDQQGQLLIQDMSEEVFKTMYNPYQYIASCMWFSITPSDIPTNLKESVSTIKMGWWDYTLSAYKLKGAVVELQETNIAIPAHPQASTRGDYLNFAPYSRRTLYGRYGTVPLDTAFYNNSSDTITIVYAVDLITGQCRANFYKVHSNTLTFTASKTFLLGTPIQLAQIGVDYLGTATTALSAGANAVQQAVSLNVGGAISTVANGIYNTLQAQMPQLETNGSNGSFLCSHTVTKMESIFYKIVDEDIVHKGRPLCELRRIDTLSGFILCAEGDLDLNCYDDERKAISKYLTTGFFWE